MRCEIQIGLTCIYTVNEPYLPQHLIKIGNCIGAELDDQVPTSVFDSHEFVTEVFSALRYIRSRLRTASYFEKLDMLVDPDDPRDLSGMLLRAGAGLLKST